MTTTTPHYGLPVPEGSDTADGVLAINTNLGQGVDALVWGLLLAASGHRHGGADGDGRRVAHADLTGAPTSLSPSGAAGGDLAGNYPSPSVGAGAVTTTKLAANAATQIVAASSAAVASTTSATPADMDLSVGLTTVAGSTVAVLASATLAHDGTSGVGNLAFAYDGTTNTQTLAQPHFATAGLQVHVMWLWTAQLSAGAHTITARWSTPAGTLSALGGVRWMLAVEFRR